LVAIGQWLICHTAQLSGSALRRAFSHRHSTQICDKTLGLEAWI
jgi:hypothetical protein